MILGIRTGSLASSAMLTESSKPTIAKKASAVPAVMAPKMPVPPDTSNSITQPKSPVPEPSAHMPIRMMISSPDNSTQISTTLALTLSPTPRKLTSAIKAMKPKPISVIALLSTPKPRSKTALRLEAKASDALLAEVRPEDITANATTNVMKWMLKALCVYSAAPAARGYLVTSSR